MITVPKMEMHLADACNLRCDGCSHYSNHGIGGILDYERGRSWLRPWSLRVSPVHFSFLGGEPTLNRQLPAFLELLRSLWPRTRLRLVTNALELDRWESLWPVLRETETLLTISIHSTQASYRERLDPMLSLARERCRRYGVRWEERDSISGWYRPYRGHGPDMTPFEDGRPFASWSACATRHCVTLHDGALWKCPPLAHLGKVAGKYGLHRNPAWRRYLSYRPLTPDATDDEIRSFFARGPEIYCGMCPSRPRFYEKTVL